MTAQKKPAPPVVELSARTHAKLLAFSREDNRPMGEIVTDLVDRYERERFRQEVREDYARLRANPAEWKSYQDEIRAWDGLTGDGLDEEPPYFTPEEEREIRVRALASTNGG
jgi:hypothetical protein